jgi:hypothetical protein
MGHRARTLSINACCLFASFSMAQSWCPPGATWTYGIAFIGTYGYQQYSYAGDTILGGHTGQRIAMEGAMQYWPDYTPVNEFSNPLALITSLQNDVVMLWSSDTLSWDTLLWLGALPGDHWQRAHAIPGVCDPMDDILVTDTTTIVVDGVPLKQLTIEQRWAGGYQESSTITERIGWNWNIILWEACMIVDGPAGMRCYSDQDISYSTHPFGCTSLVGMSEVEERPAIQLLPNPGNDHVTVDVPSAVADRTFILFDPQGRELLREHLISERAAVNTEHLRPGIFPWKVIATDGAVLGQGRWVKL